MKGFPEGLQAINDGTSLVQGNFDAGVAHDANHVINKAVGGPGEMDKQLACYGAEVL